MSMVYFDLSVITLFNDTVIPFIYLRQQVLMTMRERGEPSITTLETQAIPLLRNLQGQQGT